MAEYGIPIPRGGVATSPAEARQIAQSLGGSAVIKAQIHAGGRGKAGGIKRVESPDEAEQAAASLLGKTLVTLQTGPEGAPVGQVLVEEPVESARELYLGVVVDGATKSATIIASGTGGIAIEEVAATSPEKILRIPVDPLIGLQSFQGRDLARHMKLKPELIGPVAAVMVNVYRLFVEKDCTLAEINPLALTLDGRVLALDAKLTFDDDAAFRHKEFQELRDISQEDPLEAAVSDYDISYVRLDGDVGCLVNGAGLGMATMDLIQTVGAKPANFLDVGGGADEEKVKQAFSVILADPRVKRVLINIFGGIQRGDVVARGVVAACREQRANPTLIVRMMGTNVEEGQQILQESGLTVFLTHTFKEAAARLQEVAAA